MLVNNPKQRWYCLQVFVVINEADSYARKGMAIEAPGLFQSIDNFSSVSALHSLGHNVQCLMLIKIYVWLS